LLLDRFDRHEAHGRARDSLADRLGVRRISLTALYVRFDVGRRHQSHRVTEGREFARPMMARAASFHADQTGRELAEEGHHLRPPERAPDENLARATDGVHLEDVLGQVDADGRDLHRSGSKLLLHDSTFLAPQRREREPSSPSASGPATPLRMADNG
jgi:hypothetical protein